MVSLLLTSDFVSEGLARTLATTATGTRRGRARATSVTPPGASRRPTGRTASGPATSATTSPGVATNTEVSSQYVNTHHMQEVP